MSSTLPDAYAVLGDPLRRRIVELLAAESLCTCHLVDELGAKQPTVSHHLRVLRDADVVDTEACGRFTYYRLRPQALERLAGDLTALAGAARTAAGRRRAC
jgi:ArsR family transcriptional regulator, arsenate/arsenite/antimonite-responsive transcriptional repressor